MGLHLNIDSAKQLTTDMKTVGTPQKDANHNVVQQCVTHFYPEKYNALSKNMNELALCDREVDIAKDSRVKSNKNSPNTINKPTLPAKIAASVSNASQSSVKQLAALFEKKQVDNKEKPIAQKHTTRDQLLDNTAKDAPANSSNVSSKVNKPESPSTITPPVSNESQPNVKQLAALFEKKQVDNKEKLMLPKHTTKDNFFEDTTKDAITDSNENVSFTVNRPTLSTEPPVSNDSQPNVKQLTALFEEKSPANLYKISKKPSAQTVESPSFLFTAETAVLEKENLIPKNIKDIIKRSQDQKISPFALLANDLDEGISSIKKQDKKELKNALSIKNKSPRIQETKEITSSNPINKKKLIKEIAAYHKENKPIAYKLKLLEDSIDPGKNKMSSLHKIFIANAKKIKKYSGFIDKTNKLNERLANHLDIIKQHDKDNNVDEIITHQIEMLRGILILGKHRNPEKLIAEIKDYIEKLKTNNEKDDFITKLSKTISSKSIFIQEKKNKRAQQLKELIAENKVIYKQIERTQPETMRQSSIYDLERDEFTPDSAKEVAAHKLHREEVLHNINIKNKRVNDQMDQRLEALKAKIANHLS
ncbi:MAG: hypothetical protein PUP46_04290 [Endozoicomonas sp. (ex Botrylloides leachii)]|nr:hypothetical protein [Endozoicomonas sp. (ex Botrylloides leachii)]